MMSKIFWRIEIFSCCQTKCSFRKNHLQHPVIGIILGTRPTHQVDYLPTWLYLPFQFGSCTLIFFPLNELSSFMEIPSINPHVFALWPCLKVHPQRSEVMHKVSGSWNPTPPQEDSVTHWSTCDPSYVLDLGPVPDEVLVYSRYKIRTLS